jgi:hypothetical protein
MENKMNKIEEFKVEMFKKQLDIIRSEMNIQYNNFRDSVENYDFKHNCLSAKISAFYELSECGTKEERWFLDMKNRLYHQYRSGTFPSCYVENRKLIGIMIDEIIEKTGKLELEMLWQEDVEYCESNFLI